MLKHYAISKWEDLTMCRSNTCPNAYIHVTHFNNNPLLLGKRVTVHDPVFGVLYSALVEGVNGLMIVKIPETTVFSLGSDSRINRFVLEPENWVQSTSEEGMIIYLYELAVDLYKGAIVDLVLESTSSSSKATQETLVMDSADITVFQLEEEPTKIYLRASGIVPTIPLPILVVERSTNRQGIYSEQDEILRRLQQLGFDVHWSQDPILTTYTKEFLYNFYQLGYTQIMKLYVRSRHVVVAYNPEFWEPKELRLDDIPRSALILNDVGNFIKTDFSWMRTGMGMPITNLVE